MKPTFFYPHEALKDFVSHFMILDIKLSEPYERYVPFPPTPQHSIHFYVGNPIKTSGPDLQFHNSPQSVIVGPQASRVNLSMGKQHILLSVAFQPGGLYRLLKIPMYELYDRPYNAEDILGPALREINERLRAATSQYQMKTIVQDYLLTKLAHFPLSGFERSAKFMLQNVALANLDQAVDLSCLSLRQFERKSKELMGYSPKFFQRLIRFSQAYRLKVSHPDKSWTQIGFASGYYDQMHMIRDFKVFAGANPSIISKEIHISPIQVQDHLKI
jgi:AraC-like DNA-binding protein